MKAVVYTEYGPPEVLRFGEVAQPTPKAGEVLVSVQAASVNPADWHFMRGTPLLMRPIFGLPKPKHPILGADVAGRVEAAGEGVTRFRPGDAVFGDLSGSGLGGFAEYVCVPEVALVAKPDNLSFGEAAAVPLAAVTALQGLRDHGKLRAGQRVLVNGASGGVGTFAVQLAKALGAEVTGVCSSRNAELVRSLGADRAVDYKAADFTRDGERYDLILDAVGNRTVADYSRALSPRGVCVVVGFTSLPQMLGLMAAGTWVSRTGSKKIGSMTAKPSAEDLAHIGELSRTGAVAPAIDRRYPLAETAEAVRYLETGRARGKVVVDVVSPAPA